MLGTGQLARANRPVTHSYDAPRIGRRLLSLWLLTINKLCMWMALVPQCPGHLGTSGVPMARRCPGSLEVLRVLVSLLIEKFRQTYRLGGAQGTATCTSQYLDSSRIVTMREDRGSGLVWHTMLHLYWNRKLKYGTAPKQEKV